MKIKCDITGITPEQSMVCMAIQAMYAKQNMMGICQLVSLNPMVFTLKSNLTEQQKQRLFADSVKNYAQGYYGEVINDQLVVSASAEAKPVKSKRVRSSKSDSTVSES